MNQEPNQALIPKYFIDDNVICTVADTESTFNKTGTIEEVHQTRNGYFYKVKIGNHIFISKEEYLVLFNPQEYYPTLQQYLIDQAFNVFMETGKTIRFTLLHNKLFIFREGRWLAYNSLKAPNSKTKELHLELILYLQKQSYIRKNKLIQIGFFEDEIDELRHFVRHNTNPLIYA